VDRGDVGRRGRKTTGSSKKQRVKREIYRLGSGSRAAHEMGATDSHIERERILYLSRGYEAQSTENIKTDQWGAYKKKYLVRRQTRRAC